MPERRPLVLVDMDGVLADFDGATEDYLRLNHPEVSLARRQNFYFRDDYPDPEVQAIINELHASRYFFEKLPPMRGAALGWQRLQALGYEPRICTSPLHTNEWCEAEKLNWVERYLGRTAAQSAIVTSHKETCEGVALIDDRPEIKHADQATWQHVVFDRSYNRHVRTDLRLNGWLDSNLGQVLQLCVSRQRRT